MMHATGESFAFDVPITQQAQPNLVVSAVIVHNNQMITAQKSLKVPLVERTLTITATPSKSQYLPGEKGSFDVLAVDSGKTGQADLSFGEVDEALYSVRPDTSGESSRLLSQALVTADPQSSFEFSSPGRREIKARCWRAGQRALSSADGAGKTGSDLVVPKVRKAFPDTAYWNPECAHWR